MRRVAAAGAVACVLLAGCGAGDEGARSTLAPVQPTAYITVDAPTTTTSTIPPTPTPPPPGGSRSTSEQQWVVQAGESLSGIASKFDVTLDQLVDLNGIDGDPSEFLLTPGRTVLRIPVGAKIVDGSTGGVAGSVGTSPTATGTSPEPGSTSPDDEDDSEGEGCTHTIQAGENPSSVAAEYGITFAELQAANPNRDFTEWFTANEDINLPPDAC